MKTITSLLVAVLMVGAVSAGTNAPPFHVVSEDGFCRLTWEVSTHPLPRGWETLDPVKVHGFLNACLRHDPEQRVHSILGCSSVVQGKLLFYGYASQRAAITELLTALGGYDGDGFVETKPTQILWPVPLTIPADQRPAYSLTTDRLKLEELLDEDLGSVVILDSVEKILSYRKNQQALSVPIHSSLNEKPSGTISGKDITLRRCLEGYARSIGGRLAVREGAAVIEPAPATKREDWPTWGAVVRSHPLRLPKGVTPADVERLLTDMVALMDGKDYAALVLPDRVVAVTLDTFESHPMIENLLEKLTAADAGSTNHKETK